MQSKSLLLLMLALPALCTSEADSSLPTCGKPAVSPDETEFTGGREANQHSWPWLVSIRLNGSHQCGGSIVNESWVVTAAECVPEISDASPHFVEAGRHCRNCDETTVQRRKVAKVLIQPQYDANYTEHDLALVQVSEAFQFNGNVSPICLPTQPVTDTAACFVAGWGGTGNLSEHQLQAQLPIVPNLICGDPDHYGSGGISTNMLCAGYAKQGINFCIADFGGPFMCKSADTAVWQLHGVLSAGDSCDSPLRPQVFTRVHEYLQWITESVIAH